MAEKGRDPFLYNPRLRAAQAGKVSRDSGDLCLRLILDRRSLWPRNRQTFMSPSETYSLSTWRSRIYRYCELPFSRLSTAGRLTMPRTSGIDFSVTPLSVSIAPQSIQSIRIAGMATTAGSLEIRGVTLRLPDGAACDILLPVIDDTERKREDKRKSRAVSEYSKAKRQGIDARWPAPSEPARESAAPDALVDKWLECKVVDEQPLIWIKKTNLTHGTIMLYDGET